MRLLRDDYPPMDSLTKALMETKGYEDARTSGAPHLDALDIARERAQAHHRHYLDTTPQERFG